MVDRSKAELDGSKIGSEGAGILGPDDNIKRCDLVSAVVGRDFRLDVLQRVAGLFDAAGTSDRAFADYALGMSRIRSGEVIGGWDAHVRSVVEHSMTSTQDSLMSGRHEAADALAANELFQHNGWTDGLPVVPPTVEQVQEFLARSELRPDAVIGTEPVRRRQITAEKVAINAVMAGCLPEFLPVVIAAVEAICQEEFCLHGSTASTGGSAQFIVVNGPVRQQIGMNATHNVLGNGNRANATIGRALRLIVMNVLGGIPGTLDRATLGHAGKFAFCIAEDEEDSSWQALAQERGIPSGVSAVTVLAAEASRQVMNEWSDDPEEILETFAAEIRANMLSYSIWPGNYAVIIAKQLRDLIVAAGWQKRDVRELIYRSARVSRRDWRTAGKARLVGRGEEDQEFCALRSPDDLLVIAAGGPAGGFGAVIAPWVGNRSFAVTRSVR